jgi:hypothetical protein
MLVNEIPMVDVLRLRPLDGDRLWLRFTDGSEGVRDLSGLVAEGGGDGRAAEIEGIL